MKLLVVDIETRPALAYVWGSFKQNIGPHQIVQEKSVISFAAKWVGDDTVLFRSVFHHGKPAMLKKAHKLLSEADGVIGYNSKRFDVKHLNTEFYLADMRPPTPFRNIDLFLTMRSNFLFMSNRLENIAAKSLGEHKLEHEGFSLWLKCLNGDRAAWARMRDYNMHDVVLTEKLYHHALPWINNHPSFAAVTGSGCCPNCGHEKRQARGFQATKTGMYQRYSCKRCGKHYRETHRTSVASVTETSSW